MARHSNGIEMYANLTPRLRITLLTCVLIYGIPNAASQAQTQYYEICKSEFETARTGTERQLYAALKMTDALYFYDLELALKQVKRCQKLAEKRDDRQALAVCAMDQAVIEGWLKGDKASTEYFDRAFELFVPEHATPDLQIHFYTSHVLYEIFRNSAHANLSKQLHLNDLAASRCDDPYLVLQQHMFSAFNRVFLGNCELNHPKIQETRNRISSNNKRLKLLDANAMLTLLESWEFVESNPDECKRFLESSLDYSKQSGNRLYQLFTTGILLQIDFENSDLAEARTKIEKCVELSALHKSPALMFDSLLHLAALDQQAGQFESAWRSIKRADQIPFLDQRSASNRHRLYKVAFELSCAEEDIENIKKYAGLMFSTEHMTRVVQTETDNKRLYSQIAQIRQDNRQTIQDLRETQDELKQDFRTAQASANRKIQVLGFVAGLLAILGLLAALKFSHDRLHRVKKLLSKERESGRTGKQIRRGLESKLNRLQRMESLGLLAGGVAHDFNNLLVGVLGNAEIIKMTSEESNEFLHARVDQIISAAEKAADLSHQMLAYAGKRQIDRKTSDLNDLVSRLMPVLESNIGEDLNLDVTYWSLPLICEVDETQIEQVLMNLVSNAASATQNGGKILIRTGREEIEEVDPGLHGIRTSGGLFNYVEVQDFGDGISADDLERVFEPFYSDKRKGRGLGLAVVYGMVNGHEGLIRAESKRGKGSRFRVLIPDAQPNIESEPSTVSHITSFNPSNDIGRPTILVVDDESTVLDLSQQLLQHEGWNVLMATGGDEAVDLIVKQKDEIKCVLLDVVMGEMGAKEVLAKFHDLNVAVPVVLMSGFSHCQLTEFRHEPMVCAILEKPFRLNELLTAVNDASRSNTYAA